MDAQVIRADEHLLTLRTQYTHWWYAGRRAILRSIIEKHLDMSAPMSIADAGCGPGVNTGFLRQYGNVAACDNDEFVLEIVRRKWGDLLDVSKWTYPGDFHRKYDLVVMTDVLEHFEDDSGVPAWLHSQLNDGGHALITVPACKYLWSEMDDVMGHFRRYNRQMLQRLFQTHFDVVRMSYYNFILLPLKLLGVLFSRLRSLFLAADAKRTFNEIPPPPLNGLFYLCNTCEAILLPAINFPVGAGIVTLLKKKTR